MNEAALRNILLRVRGEWICEEPYLGSDEDTERYYPEETPTLYFLDEILALRNRSPEDLREIHRAKLTFPGQRVIQEGPEKLLGQGTSDPVEEQ